MNMEIKKFRNLNNILKKNGKVIKTINESQIALNNEIRALKLLNGCCAPKLLSRFGKSLTMTEINGQHLSEVKITPVVMKKLAEALNKIHSYKSERKCFIHGDLHKDNIVLTKQGIVFLDFVKAKFDDPLMDAAAVEIHITNNKKLLKNFYKIFHAKEERKKIDFYKYKHCLGHLEWAEKEGFFDLAKKSKKIIQSINIELVNKDDFDFLGIFLLNDVYGIENFVEKTKEGYLSRNASYYLQKTLKDCSRERKYCSKLLPLQGKKALVVAERMLNNSCRFYYNKYLSLLKSKNQNSCKKEFEIAKKCLEEDSKRVVDALENKVVQPTKIILPESGETTDNRFIEADNKWILYDTVKQFPLAKHIISLLYGGILIGPFFKAIKQTNYTHILFGMHDQDSQKHVKNNLVDNVNKIILKNDYVNLPREVVIIDDNIGTGKTLEILKRTFSTLGKKAKIAGIEMSWTYYDQVKMGLRKTVIFNINSIDFPTFRDTRHHAITEKLVNALRKGGNNYLKELKLLGFHNNFIPDDILLFNRGKSIAEQYNLKFKSYLNKTTNFVLSMDLMNRKIRYLEKEPLEKTLNIIRDYETVNIIDLDRYNGEEPNLDIIRKILQIKKCRIGGGIKTKDDVRQLLDLGAQKVIIGTHAYEDLLKDFPKERIVIALDSINRKNGEKRKIKSLIRRLEDCCDEFQYVCVEKDGKAKGGDTDKAIRYSKLTKNKFNCVGGISTKKEMLTLKKHDIGCVVGRALQDGYFG